MRTATPDSTTLASDRFPNLRPAPPGVMMATRSATITRSSHLRHFLAFFAFMTFLHFAIADCRANWIISPTVPEQFRTTKGSVTVVVTLADGSLVTDSIAIAAGLSLSDKLTTIASGLNSPQYQFQNAMVNMVGTTVTFGSTYGTAAKSQAIESAHIFQANTGETDTISKPLADPIGVQQIITFAGTLSGVNRLGTSATYTTAFGYDGFSISSSIAYASLEDKTAGGLLSATYQNLLSQLSPGMQGELSLNLAAGSITLLSPGSITSPSTTNGTDDISVISSCEVCLPSASVPEPSSVVLALIGMPSVCYVAWRRGRRTDRSRSGRPPSGESLRHPDRRMGAPGLADGRRPGSLAGRLGTCRVS